ncbi:hypothetical protein CK203_018139 [Vitis vinifera]|uniref:Uncharacterized protein n=1 Tax=Vitis vinifera TaxID=29760 RepID=A0A438JNZ7_VITVI|nr:hypothetical protein CK203_018139 [Vitis vinifera]
MQFHTHSYDYARIYVLKRTRRVEVEGGIVNVQNDYCRNSTEETHNSVASCQANNEFNLGLSQGFMSRCAETEVMPHDLNVECSSQPSMRGRRGARVIKQGSLFSTTTYDANDGMFPITFGVEERHYTIFNLVMTHMDKFAHLACYHMGATENWKAPIGPKTEEKLLENIIKSGSLPVSPYVGAIRQMKQDVYEYVDSYFKLPMQELIYSGHFNSIPNHNMPIVDVDGCVRDAQGRLYPSLKPPCSKRPPGRPQHRRIESQFSSKRLIFCSRCQVAGHNRASCKNPLPAP